MKTTAFIILFVSIFLLSCNNQRENNSDLMVYTDANFKKYETLSGINYGNFADSLVMPGKFLLIDNRLIIIDRKSKKPIHLIDIANDSYLGNFGLRGQGPGEITVAWSLSAINDDEFLLYDIGLRKVLAYNLDSILTNPKPLFEKKINQESVSTSICLLNQNFFYTDDYNWSNRLFSIPLDFKSDTMLHEKGYGESPLLINPQETDFVKADAAGAIMKQHNGIFAFAYKFAPRIDIFNSKENRWNSIISPEEFDIVYKSIKEGDIEIFAISEETRNAYLDVTVTEKHIYALFSKEKVLDHSYSQGNLIYVYDLQGNPVRKIKLEQPILYFDVASDESYLYGLKMDILPQILKFKLN